MTLYVETDCWLVVPSTALPSQLWLCPQILVLKCEPPASPSSSLILACQIDNLCIGEEGEMDCIYV